MTVNTHQPDPERMRLMDGIVGRCLRDPDFAKAILTHPDHALASFGLTDPELDDFRALARQDHASVIAGWAELTLSLWPR